ncbi:ATP-grasp domain-containing protein [Lachnospiraceae bacterium 29-84]
MKNLLILNGSHSEISLIEEAKKLGFYVITSGSAPELIGHSYADEYVAGDYSDKELMLQIAQDKKIEAVISCANDFGIITASYIAEKMGLKGHDSYETTLCLHQKDQFKQFALKNNMQVVQSDTYTDISQAISKRDDYQYPIIVKPVDLTGGKGVRRINVPGDYEESIRVAFKMSRVNRIVIEQFVEGSYHSFSTFLVNKQVVATYSDNEYSFLNPYLVAASAGPAKNVEEIRSILIRQAEFVAKRLDLVNGVFHMQYVMDKNRKPYIIDITRRCSGDLYSEPVEYSVGIPWSKWIVMSESGFPEDYFCERGTQKKFCGRCCIMAKQNGKVRNVKIADEIRSNIYKNIQWWKKGDLINNYLVDKLGVLFWEFSTEDEMYEKLNSIGELIQVEVI